MQSQVGLKLETHDRNDEVEREREREWETEMRSKSVSAGFWNTSDGGATS